MKRKTCVLLLAALLAGAILAFFLIRALLPAKAPYADTWTSGSQTLQIETDGTFTWMSIVDEIYVPSYSKGHLDGDFLIVESHYSDMRGNMRPEEWGHEYTIDDEIPCEALDPPAAYSLTLLTDQLLEICKTDGSRQLEFIRNS